MKLQPAIEEAKASKTREGFIHRPVAEKQARHPDRAGTAGACERADAGGALAPG